MILPEAHQRIQLSAAPNEDDTFTKRKDTRKEIVSKIHRGKTTCIDSFSMYLDLVSSLTANIILNPQPLNFMNQESPIKRIRDTIVHCYHIQATMDGPHSKTIAPSHVIYTLLPFLLLSSNHQLFSILQTHRCKEETTVAARPYKSRYD